MYTLTNNQKIHYTLRVASSMCFIGHGAFGIITKPIWCNYFALFGIDHATAYRLMPLLRHTGYSAWASYCSSNPSAPLQSG